MPAASSASSTANGRSSRSGPSKRIVVLKLSTDLLSQFVTPPPEGKDKKSKRGSVSNTDSPVKIQEPSSPASSSAELPLPPSSVDNASDAASTPAAGTSAADTPRRKGVPGPKPGTKRGLNQTGETTPKPRGKPGPKKKPRLYVFQTRSIGYGAFANCSLVMTALSTLPSWWPLTSSVPRPTWVPSMLVYAL